VALQSTPDDGQRQKVLRGEHRPESAGALIGRLMSEATTLIRKELALAKAELAQAADQTKTALIAMAAGGAVLFAGALAVLAALILLLGEFVAPWIAAGVVGLILAICGYLMLQSGKQKLDPGAFKPERTQEAMRKDKKMIQRRTTQ